jgi:hypothetical protein
MAVAEVLLASHELGIWEGDVGEMFDGNGGKRGEGRIGIGFEALSGGLRGGDVVGIWGDENGGEACQV